MEDSTVGYETNRCKYGLLVNWMYLPGASMYGDFPVSINSIGSMWGALAVL